jgi:hypothetical protein
MGLSCFLRDLPIGVKIILQFSCQAMVAWPKTGLGWPGVVLGEENFSLR